MRAVRRRVPDGRIGTAPVNDPDDDRLFAEPPESRVLDDCFEGDDGKAKAAKYAIACPSCGDAPVTTNLFAVGARPKLPRRPVARRVVPAGCASGMCAFNQG